MKERRADARGILFLHWHCCHLNAGFLSPAVLTLKCSQYLKKKKEEAGIVLSLLYHRALTGWESHPDIFPLALELVRHVSSLRCCFSFPATDTVARSEQGGCMCAHKRTVTWWHSLVSFFTFLRCFACRRKNKARFQRGQRTSGRSEGEGGWRRWQAGCWGADTAELYCGPDFIYETRARMDHRPAGRPICCSCPGNTQQWSMGIYRHQLNLSLLLPPPLWFLTLPLAWALFILHFLFSFRSLLEQNLTTGMLLMSQFP